MYRDILFIVNPKAGNQKSVERLIEDEFVDHKGTVQIITTMHRGHAAEIAAENRSFFKTIVAVGGDGTINEVASQLVHSDVKMGIVPRGSGNGLSYFLGIPVNLSQALQLVRDGDSRIIDTMKLNERCFVNMAGIGFDAHVANIFNEFGSRGFASYIRIVIREFLKYPGISYEVKTNIGSRLEEAFVLSFANSSQYGNNAHIAPYALIDDGLIDICKVAKFPGTSALGIVLKLFRGNIHKSRYYSYHQTSEFNINSKNDLIAHIDGEPIWVGKQIQVKVIPKSLKVIMRKN
ncbi:MAG: diacylglycerol kinase family lipid kinase [Bacteroidetes bacterium]|nr:diacylglycerol kinase family lipid kinase [Bacteroidota bacterium]MDA1119767.1 diacylglycerol kinase family lipid kinase [Bacteroidota bacterium]